MTAFLWTIIVIKTFALIGTFYSIRERDGVTVWVELVLCVILISWAAYLL